MNHIRTRTPWVLLGSILLICSMAFLSGCGSDPEEAAPAAAENNDDGGGGSGNVAGNNNGGNNGGGNNGGGGNPNPEPEHDSCITWNGIYGGNFALEASTTKSGVCQNNSLVKMNLPSNIEVLTDTGGSVFNVPDVQIAFPEDLKCRYVRALNINGGLGDYIFKSCSVGGVVDNTIAAGDQVTVEEGLVKMSFSYNGVFNFTRYISVKMSVWISPFIFNP